MPQGGEKQCARVRRHAGQCPTTGSLETNKPWGCGGSVCQFLWCNYSHLGPLQTVIMMSLNMELERDMRNWLFQVCVSGSSTLMGRRIYDPETLF